MRYGNCLLGKKRSYIMLIPVVSFSCAGIVHKPVKYRAFVDVNK